MEFVPNHCQEVLWLDRKNYGNTAHARIGETCEEVHARLLSSMLGIFVLSKSSPGCLKCSLYGHKINQVPEGQMMQMMKTFMKQGGASMLREAVTEDFVTGTVLEWMRPYLTDGKACEGTGLLFFVHERMIVRLPSTHTSSVAKERQIWMDTA